VFSTAAPDNSLILCLLFDIWPDMPVADIHVILTSVPHIQTNESFLYFD